MASGISEVRARFSGTATSLMNTISDMRSSMQNFGRNTQTDLQGANTAMSGFEQSTDQLRTALNQIGSNDAMDTLVNNLQQAQSEFTQTGTVGQQGMESVERAIEEARRELENIGDSGDSAFQQLEAAINAAENDLQNLGSVDVGGNIENDLQQAEVGADDLGEAFTEASEEAEAGADDVEESMGGLKTKILEVVGAVAGIATIGAGFMTAFNVTEDYHEAMNNLERQTGATGKEMGNMGEIMKNIYANNFGEDFNDIAESMSLVTRATGDTGKALQDTTEYAIRLRDSFDMDVGESAATAGQMMKNFGVSSKEAYELMAQGAQSGLDKNGEMLETFDEFSTNFAQLGYDAEGMWNVLQAGSQAGAYSVNVVADSVSEFGKLAKDGSDATAEAFAGLGLNADEMSAKVAAGGPKAQKAMEETFAALGTIEDPMQRNAIGIALFGSMFEDLEHKSIIALGNVKKEANQSGDVLKNMNNVKYDTIGSAITGIKKTLEVSLIEPMEKRVMPVVNSMVNSFRDNMPAIKSAVSSAFDGMGSVVESLAPTIKNVFGVLKDLAPVVITPIVIAFGVLKEVIGPVLEGVSGIAKAITGWEGFAPILTGIVVAMTTYWGIMKTVTIATKTWLAVTKAAAIAQRAFTAAQIAFAIAGGGIAGIINGIKAAMVVLNVTMLANPIVLVIAALVGLGAAFVVLYNKSETFRNFINGLWGAIKDGFSGMLDWFTTTIPAWISSISTKLGELWTWIKGFFAEWGLTLLTILAPFIGIPILIAQNWDSIKAFFAALWESIKSGVSSFGTAISTFFSGLWTTISTIVGNMVTSVMTIIGGWITTLQNIFAPLGAFFTATWENIKMLVLGIIGVFLSAITLDFDGLKLSLLAIWTAIKSQIVNIITTFKEVATNLFSAFKTGVTKIFDGIKTAVVAAWEYIKTKSVAIVKGAKDGVVEGFNTMKSKISDTISNLKTSVSDGWTSIKTKSVDTVNGLKTGVTTAWSNLKKSISDAISNIKSSVSTGFSGAKTSATDAMDGLKSGVSSAISKVKGFFTDMKSKIISTVKGISLKSIGSDIVSGMANGIKGSAQKVFNQVKSLANGVKSKLKSMLGIHSPSRVTRELGEFTGEGLALGIGSMIGKVSSVAGRMAGAVTDALDLSSAVGGVANATASITTEQTLRHEFDLANVPQDINQETLTSSILTALGHPTVKRKIDQVNAENLIGLNKTIGVR